MTYKAFCALIHVQNDSDLKARAVFYASVLDSQGALVINPLTNDYSTFNETGEISPSSTLASLRAEFQSKLVANYGFTPTFVWLDDKGLI